MSTKEDMGFNFRNREKEKFCGVYIYNPKLAQNVGTLIRTAVCLGNVDYIAIIGERYKHQHSDTAKGHLQIPVFFFKGFEEAFESLPLSCQHVAMELSPKATNLARFEHPKRAAYFLGAEDLSLPPEIVKRCYHKVQIPMQTSSLNLSVAGSVLLYDRYAKLLKGE